MKKVLLLITPAFLAVACQSPAGNIPAKADTTTQPASTATGIAAAKADTAGLIAVMQKSAADWNKGDLAGFMDSYDDSATMMSHHGLIGKDSMMIHYRQTYFKEGAARQHLTFDQFKITPLDGNYVLLTGRFTLNGHNLPTLSGWFSLTCVHTPKGWKVLHDHTS
ncbi:MAG TPA: nuclear transport factor 2 family protein [Puia sp.]|uniref:YybH family protein n=1 Tax=Puia sp. TaxID=2045100 RepID=UPI002B901B28|nr:nuclear transport factor 2 family protein [Puia sp.]HVU99346.1 nuclear transport factor 2 family protein [Puia sp.]